MNHRTCNFLRGIAAAALLAAGTCHAAVFQWDVNLDFVWGGGKGSGTFVSDGSSFSDWDITTFHDYSVPTHEEIVYGYHYTSSTSTLVLDGNNVRLLRNDEPQDPGIHAGNLLSLWLVGGMAQGGSFAGASANEYTLSLGGSAKSQAGMATYLALGEAFPVAAPVPEPGALALLALGLGLTAAAARRRRAG